MRKAPIRNMMPNILIVPTNANCIKLLSTVCFLKDNRIPQTIENAVKSINFIQAGKLPMANAKIIIISRINSPQKIEADNFISGKFIITKYVIPNWTIRFANTFIKKSFFSNNKELNELKEAEPPTNDFFLAKILLYIAEWTIYNKEESFFFYFFIFFIQRYKDEIINNKKEKHINEFKKQSIFGR